MAHIVAFVVNLLTSLALLATVAVWLIIVDRLRHGRPLLRVEPRRDVPWHGRDVLAILVLYMLAGMLLGAVYKAFISPDITLTPFGDTPDAMAKQHLLVDLFVKADWSVRIACTLLAVVVAPVFEEMFFRLFLQGWLEKIDRRLRRHSAALASLCRWGTLPVLITTVFFALLHWRGERGAFALDQTLFFMLVDSIIKVLLVIAIIVLAHRLRGATWADLGVVPDQLGADVRLGLSTAAATIIPLYVVLGFLSYLLNKILPFYIAPDPILLFFFALVLGTLYLRTHRIVPSIVAHATLNAVGMVLMWLQVLS